MANFESNDQNQQLKKNQEPKEQDTDELSEIDAEDVAGGANGACANAYCP